MVEVYKSHKLWWFNGKLNGQPFDFLLDCGASVCCIAKRCVTSNRLLKNLPVHSYNGPEFYGANSKPLKVDNIRVRLVVGTPKFVSDIDFVIVENLPYSCIAGNSFLNGLQQWGVNNSSCTLSLNSCCSNRCLWCLFWAFLKVVLKKFSRGR